MKVRVYKGGKHQNYDWCVGIGKGHPPFQQCRSWKTAVDYAYWWYVNKHWH